MPIRVIVAGATGWVGRAIAEAVLAADDLRLVGAVARRSAGQDLGEALGRGAWGVLIHPTVKDALETGADVLVDYTHPAVVKGHVKEALRAGLHVVVGTSGLDRADFAELDRIARARGRGVIAAGNFSLTAALAKRFALMAARALASWEIVEYAAADKIDAPGGTVRELAEALEDAGPPAVPVPADHILGDPATRGGVIGGTHVHAVRLPGMHLAFDVLFGQPDERLVIRHEAGASPAPYVAGTLKAIRAVPRQVGLVRGLDRLLFGDDRPAETGPTGGRDC